MAVCPFAVNKLIAPGANDPRITPRTAILHVDAGNALSLFSYFSHRSGGIESHFHIQRNGIIEQYRDTDYQADANHRANDFAISIETQGFGPGRWTKAQLASIKRLLVWLHETHDIPLEKCRAWDAAGVGYHVQFGAPGPWTPVAKSCPGPQRIKQFEANLVPWMRQVSAPSRPARPAAPGKPERWLPLVDLSNVARQARVAQPVSGVRRVQAALNAELGVRLDVDGVFGPATRAAYRKWQVKLGYRGGDADGIPGEDSLRKLGVGRFRTVA